MNKDKSLVLHASEEGQATQNLPKLELNASVH